MAIKLSGLLSDFFPVGGGTRQGFPVSPDLFALLTEPLAAALRASTEAQGIQVGSLTEKTLLCADDMVLFLRYSDSSLWAALDNFELLCFILRSEGQLG